MNTALSGPSTISFVALNPVNIVMKTIELIKYIIATSKNFFVVFSLNAAFLCLIIKYIRYRIIAPKIMSNMYHQPYHANANNPVANPAPIANHVLCFTFFVINPSIKIQVINNGKNTLYASVSENPAGVLPNNIGWIASNTAATTPVIFPPNLLPMKKQGIIANMEINIGTINVDFIKESFPNT